MPANPFYEALAESNPNFNRAMFMLREQINTVADLERFWYLYDGKR